MPSITQSRAVPTRTDINHNGPFEAVDAAIARGGSDDPQIFIQFVAHDGQTNAGPPLQVPSSITPPHLVTLLNNLIHKGDQEELYTLSIDGLELTHDLKTDALSTLKKSTETILPVTYHPQAPFHVRILQRCSSTLNGHEKPILVCQFSPDGKKLASGSGDRTARIWDPFTQTPQFQLQGHAGWVQVIAWSPNARMLATGSSEGSVYVWSVANGKTVAGPLRGHKKAITGIAWEPFHLNPSCVRFATGSFDGTIRVWNVASRCVLFTMAQHEKGVTCLRWSSQGNIISASRDCTIRVWESKRGACVRTLKGHGHWVNTMALNTDYVLRTGPFDHLGAEERDQSTAVEKSLERLKKVLGNREELLVSGSDDFTLYLWEPTKSSTPTRRMTGHQLLVNHVTFSPDGALIASASFDKTIRIWDPFTGGFLYTIRGHHVGAVYQLSFSSDSRHLVSASRDGTCKVFRVKKRVAEVAKGGRVLKAMVGDLCGHTDQVYCVDWAPTGEWAASGGRDCNLRIWRH